MKNSSYICCLSLFALSIAAPAYAIDLQPGELRAPRPDVNFMQLSYQYSERGAKYQHGDKSPLDTEINAGQLQVRLGRTFEIAELPSIFYIQTPMGYVHPDGALSALEGGSGVGDTSMLLAVWPYANHETQSYLAVGAYLTLPTGNYDEKRFFNMGENRYRTALQAGWQAPLLGNLHWMAALDAVWFGDNDDYLTPVGRLVTLEQKALYTAQAGLRYDINNQYSLGATYFYTAGGETTVNDLSQDNVTQLNRYQLTAVANYAFGRITLQYGNDINTENGYIEDQRWILRYTRLF